MTRVRPGYLKTAVVLAVLGLGWQGVAVAEDESAVGPSSGQPAQEFLLAVATDDTGADDSLLSTYQSDSAQGAVGEANGDGATGEQATDAFIGGIEEALRETDEASASGQSGVVFPQGVSPVSAPTLSPAPGTAPVHAGRPASRRSAQAGRPSAPTPPSGAVTEEPREEDERQTAGPARQGETPVSLEAFVDKSTATIGEKIRYTILVEADKDVDVEFPQVGVNLGGFAIRDFEVSKAKPAGWHRVRREQWYLLDTYTVGSYVIPPQTIVATLPGGQTKTLASPELFVEVKSLLGEGAQDGGLRDIKDPVEIPADIRPVLILAGLGVLALFAGAAGWWWYRRRFRREVSEPPLPAHEAALRELARIEGMDLIRSGQVREYYYLVSNCLRRYLEDRFALRAPEQTTEEFLESVSRGDALEGRYVNRLKEYLSHCDLVKYAKLEPESHQAQALAEKTRVFIEETKITEQAAEAQPTEVAA